MMWFKILNQATIESNLAKAAKKDEMNKKKMIKVTKSVGQLTDMLEESETK